MTQIEWIACDRTELILDSLGSTATDRKCRLFAVACCRDAWPRLLQCQTTPPTSYVESDVWIERLPKIVQACQNVIDAAERFADGIVKRTTLYAARRSAESLMNDERLPLEIGYGFIPATISLSLARRDGIRAAREAATVIASRIASNRGMTDGYFDSDEFHVGFQLGNDQEEQVQCDLLRDVFFPYCTAIAERDWLTWNDNTVPKFAQTIYDDRRFEIMPILADALEEAGCDSADILTHCRGPGPHVRGCWVVDLLLDKA